MPWKRKGQAVGCGLGGCARWRALLHCAALTPKPHLSKAVLLKHVDIHGRCFLVLEAVPSLPLWRSCCRHPKLTDLDWLRSPGLPPARRVFY